MNAAKDSKSVAKKWNIVSVQSNVNYDVGNEIIYNTEVLKSNLCDYNDGYILLKSDITVTKCIIKIDGTAIDDPEDLDLVMLMYKLIEYIKNYSETTAGLFSPIQIKLMEFQKMQNLLCHQNK